MGVANGTLTRAAYTLHQTQHSGAVTRCPLEGVRLKWSGPSRARRIDTPVAAGGSGMSGARIESNRVGRPLVRHSGAPAALWRGLLVLCALLSLLGSRGALAHPAARTALERAAQIAGRCPLRCFREPPAHYLQAPGAAGRPLTLTIVLRRTDEAGFERYLAGVQDPHSLSYRHFLTQPELADQFGPSRAAYDDVLAWLQAQGFVLVQGSANRLTLTVSGHPAAGGTGIQSRSGRLPTWQTYVLRQCRGPHPPHEHRWRHPYGPRTVESGPASPAQCHHLIRIERPLCRCPPTTFWA